MVLFGQGLRRRKPSPAVSCKIVPPISVADARALAKEFVDKTAPVASR